jgi:hypothetical protein
MKRMLFGLGLLALTTTIVSEASAQWPGETVVYETASPGTRTVTYGERTIVKRKLFKTVIRERPTRFVTVTPPVVRETRYYQAAPVIQQSVVQPEPVLETRFIQPAPVIRTRFVGPYPY